MKSPRLTGATLRRARAASGQWPLNRAVRAQAFRDYRLDQLEALPMEYRMHFDEVPVPHAGAPPRLWHDAKQGVPLAGGHRWSARHAASRFAAGTLTPTALLDALRMHVARGAWEEALYSPFVGYDWDRAAQDAAASNARYRSGTPQGPLDGMPLVIKDHHHIPGMPTWGGSNWSSEIMQEESLTVTRMRAAGASVYGKTHTTEWGMQPTGYNPNWDMPHNPYDRNFGAGGSSTGTGVAVAMGLTPAGIGSDGGGSIRIPASVNGVFGIKPTYQRLSRTGDAWCNSTVGHNGPLGQTTGDLVELLLATGVGRDPLDPTTWFAPPDEDPAQAWRAALGRGVRGCRIGLWREGWQQADPAIASVCRDALAQLERAGAVLVDLDIPLADLAPALGVVMIGVETMGMLTDVLKYHGERTSDDVRFMMQLLQQVSAQEFFVAQRTRAGLRRTLAKAIADVDVLALPSVNMAAPAFAPSENRVAILDDHAIQEMTRYAFLGNLTGLPAGSVPVGRVGALPIGLQIMGDAWDEASVFAVMAEVERIGLSDLPAPKAFFRLPE